MKINKLNIGLGGILALIGSFVAILSIIISVFLPGMMSVWRTDADMELTPDGGIYLNWFGFFTGTIGIPDVAFYVLMGGILILLGSAFSILGVLKRSKLIEIIGSGLILVAPILVIFDLLFGAPDYIHSFPILTGEVLSNFFGTTQAHALGEDILFTWGLSVGYFMVIAGGILGLIGGMFYDHKLSIRKKKDLN
ncbi:MAG: hypothetical protein ACFE9S_04230 [Candidatus Hermodarchaeota archaeon]